MKITTPEKVDLSSKRLKRLTRALPGYIDADEVFGVITPLARRGQIHTVVLIFLLPSKHPNLLTRYQAVCLLYIIRDALVESRESSPCETPNLAKDLSHQDFKTEIIGKISLH